MTKTPRTDDLDSKTKGRSWPLACGEHIELSRQLERELADMTSERDAARYMLILKERCDMPADYAAMVQRLEAERDAIKNLADVIARDYAEVVREFNEVKATLADYKAQLCKPDDCERVKRLECELAKVREELRRACAYMRSTHHKFVDDQNEVKRIEELK